EGHAAGVVDERGGRRAVDGGEAFLERGLGVGHGVFLSVVIGGSAGRRVVSRRQRTEVSGSGGAGGSAARLGAGLVRGPLRGAHREGADAAGRIRGRRGVTARHRAIGVPSAARADAGVDQVGDPHAAAPALQVQPPDVDPVVGEEGEDGGGAGRVGGDVALGAADEEFAELAAGGGGGQGGEAFRFGVGHVLGEDESVDGGRERSGQPGYPGAEPTQFVQHVGLDGHEQSPFGTLSTRADHSASKASRSRRSSAVSGSSHAPPWASVGPAGTSATAGGGAGVTRPSAASRRSSTRVWKVRQARAEAICAAVRAPSTRARVRPRRGGRPAGSAAGRRVSGTVSTAGSGQMRCSRSRRRRDSRSTESTGTGRTAPNQWATPARKRGAEPSGASAKYAASNR